MDILVHRHPETAQTVRNFAPREPGEKYLATVRLSTHGEAPQFHVGALQAPHTRPNQTYRLHDLFRLPLGARAGSGESYFPPYVFANAESENHLIVGWAERA